MRTGRLSISRGHPPEATDEHPPHLALVPPAAEPAPATERAPSTDLRAVNERLGALERLLRLYEQGALSVEEFAAEKMLILGDPPRVAPVHFVPTGPRRRRGPSLLARLLSWQFLLLSVVAGIGFSFATQPGATTRLATQLWHSVAG
jgi:hypothetical protein